MAPLIRSCSFVRSHAASAALLATTPCWAQPATTAEAQLPAVVVTGRATPSVGVAGWGDLPLSRAPFQARVFNAEEIRDRGVQRLSDLTGFDPSVSDAYNTEGYWDYLTVRGFVLDNRFNYRRDGLPISAETSIPLDNKSQIEILKGSSGMQAGTSAPGGLVNYVVKRPLDRALRSASLEWREAGSVSGAVDLSQRFGANDTFGLRLNAAAARLDPKVRDAQGHRHLLALAGDWRLAPGTLVEVEFETSHRSQPSQPGFSLLGNTVPTPVDPRLNLNNQPWSLPVVLDGDTASLRWQQTLSNDWKAMAHLARQQLRSDDRVAFPFGFDCNPTSTFTGVFYCDRYAPDGRFDFYDFRSDNERRRADALDLSLQGSWRAGHVDHQFTAGVLAGRVHNRFDRQANNYVGVGLVDGSAVTPSNPAALDENTNRDERSTEWYVRDAIAITQHLRAWFGLRHTRLQRESVRTDGSLATGYAQSFNAPFIAASYEFAADQQVYASWGRGFESDVAPNRTRYANAGEALSSKSRQYEVGMKGSIAQHEWNLAAFDIVRPLFADIGSCDVDDSCTRQLDGTQRHRGIEADATTHISAWILRGGVQWLHARRENSATAAFNGLQPTNVPARTLKLQLGYDVAQWPGLSLLAGMRYESRRQVLPDNSASIPGFSRADASARYETRTAGSGRWVWRAGIDNLFDKRAWRESPYQFGHAYLFPLAPRTLRLSVQADL